eukprot:TRINITY_DN29550_c0_g1_i1.p1 TRINITY_DN29550_c0_g1~~TRINITY_DN29550_c0_g1_i1.p1  ORF type:complete len:295 (-),score=43.39 TRINITY_DN29550_c0_g1_i1:637-1521(-)
MTSTLLRTAGVEQCLSQSVSSHRDLSVACRAAGSKVALREILKSRNVQLKVSTCLPSRTVSRSLSSCQMVRCNAAETSTVEASTWVPVIPIEALPKGDRRLVRQDGETILLLWYRNEIYAIENTSPAEGAYAEGFINAKLTQDGCIVCPSTDSTYELKTGRLRDWYPKNPVLRLLTKSVRDMIVYPVKVENYQICVDLGAAREDSSAEVVFGGNIKVGQTASDVAVDEVRMVVDEGAGGFGFTRKNELVNGRAAMVGFVLLLVIEVTTGKGFLATTGFLNFLYRTALQGFPILP